MCGGLLECRKDLRFINPIQEDEDELSRRDFLKLSGGTAVAGAAAGDVLKPQEALAAEKRRVLSARRRPLPSVLIAR